MYQWKAHSTAFLRRLTLEKTMTKQELESCVYTYGKDIYSFCKYLTCSKQEADDLYQDTFLTAIEQRERIDSTSHPKNYLLSIALRIWKNKKRKYAWRKRIAEMRSLVDEKDILSLPEKSPFHAEGAFS